MKSLRLLLVAAVLGIANTAALAQIAATIEGVQMPAWVERAGRRVPIIPGMELRAGDEVVTGAGSRLLVKLGDGSLVKLGEKGQLRFAELNPARELFKAALNVLEGAFRFTTDVVAKNRKREVSIRAAQVTAGIRGTDVWGRARPANEIVCLIEGEVEVTAEGEPPVTMNRPLQFFRRIEGKTQPVGTVEQKQLDQWSAEVDLQAGKGVARRSGRFSVILASADEQNAALALYDQLQSAGYPAELWPVKQADKLVYFVRIRQLPSRAEAEALANQLRGKFGITEPKVSG
ncbi:MAG TPA: FecR domain-containing protein [Burkholderiales bacterium]|nr:FecR domain-containing protein [Burkholderiales bacterium]